MSGETICAVQGASTGEAAGGSKIWGKLAS